jgi:hypothetical protein
MNIRAGRSLHLFLSAFRYPARCDGRLVLFLWSGALIAATIALEFVLILLANTLSTTDLLHISLSVIPPSLSGSGGAMMFLMLVGMLWLTISGMANRGVALKKQDAYIELLKGEIARLQVARAICPPPAE